MTFDASMEVKSNVAMIDCVDLVLHFSVGRISGALAFALTENTQAAASKVEVNFFIFRLSSGGGVGSTPTFSAGYIPALVC